MIVVDTNIVIAYFLEYSEKKRIYRKLLEREPKWCVPALWKSEMISALGSYVVFRDLSIEDASSVYRRASQIIGENVFEVDGLQVLDFSIQYGLTTYDSEFAVLAHNRNCLFVTLDKQILKALPKVAVAPKDFI